MKTLLETLAALSHPKAAAYDELSGLGTAAKNLSLFDPAKSLLIQPEPTLGFPGVVQGRPDGFGNAASQNCNVFLMDASEVERPLAVMVGAHRLLVPGGLIIASFLTEDQARNEPDSGRLKSVSILGFSLLATETKRLAYPGPGTLRGLLRAMGYETVLYESGLVAARRGGGDSQLALDPCWLPTV